ncbi:MAG: sugar phosphate isomerase/epimerase family protein [Labedaea sp.]
MRLAYSTLACPKWTWWQAITEAGRLGYDGIEWRLVDGEFITADLPVELAAEIGKATADHGLGVPALDSSISLSVAPGPERDRTIAATRQLLRLARALGAEHLRVFPGTYPESVADATAMEWVTDMLEELRPAARDTGVAIALELHDSFDWNRAAARGTTCSSFVAEVLRGQSMPEVGVQWDVGNPYLEGESAADTWRTIAPWFRYMQLKDMVRGADGRWTYTPVGEGQLPLRDILDYIGGARFDGWVSFEWEKKWHPELAEPAEVLPDFVHYMAGYRTAR